MTDEELSDLIRKDASQHTLSGSARASIRTRIALEAATQTAQRTPSPKPMTKLLRRSSTTAWRSALVGMACGVLLTTLVTTLRTQVPDELAIADELVADHIKSLGPGPLTAIPSNDRHNVKPWFQGKLDFAPVVLNLKDNDFALLGGRVEHVHGQAVAALVYGHKQHVMNLFVMPSSSYPLPTNLIKKGFTVMAWTDGDLTYCLVSDMDTSSAEKFVATWRVARSQI